MPAAKKPTKKSAPRLDSVDIASLGGTKLRQAAKDMKELDKAIAETLKPKLTGRPSSYTDEVGDEICARITEGQSLRKICRDDHMPSLATIFNWLRVQPIFLEQYTRAKENQADTNAEDIQELIEEVRTGVLDPQAARVAGDLLKWSSSKLKPKKYGDKLDLTSDGKQLPQPIISIATPKDDDNNS